MAFIYWRKKYAYLCHTIRIGKKVKRKILAYLGKEPVITKTLIATVEEKYPGVQIDWDKIRNALKNRKVFPIPSSNTSIRPILWAYFEALRKNQIEPGFRDDIPIWDRVPGQLPRRITMYSQADAHQFLWPIFLEQIEKCYDLTDLILQPDELATIAKNTFTQAELAYVSQKRLWNKKAVPKKLPLKPMSLTRAYEIMQLPDEGKKFWETKFLEKCRDELLSNYTDSNKLKLIEEAYQTIITWQKKELKIKRRF